MGGDFSGDSGVASEGSGFCGSGLVDCVELEFVEDDVDGVEDVPDEVLGCCAQTVTAKIAQMSTIETRSMLSFYRAKNLPAASLHFIKNAGRSGGSLSGLVGEVLRGGGVKLYIEDGLLPFVDAGAG